MKTKLPIINTLLLVAILGYIIVGTLNVDHDDNEVYVVTGELFSEFEYQKELDSEFRAIKESKMKELELLKKDVFTLEQRARLTTATDEDVVRYQSAYNNYLQKEASLNTELAELNGQYSVQIWDKLNAFVADFGEQNNYEVIFGAGGNGNIMYAQEKKNITQELIAFCNQKYNGK